MSTRSTVAIENDDGTFEAIYCHFDGYDEGGVGETLKAEHNSEDAARTLIANGDHSSIAGGCDPYKNRDGEDWDDIKPRTLMTKTGLDTYSSGMGAEYLHLFMGGEWVSSSVG